MKIKKVSFKDSQLAPCVSVEFDGEQSTRPLVEDLISALTEELGLKGLEERFWLGEHGRANRYLVERKVNFLGNDDPNTAHTFFIAEVITARQDNQARIFLSYLYEIIEQKEFLNKYAGRLTSMIEQ